MPRIDRRFLDISVYLYPSKVAAEKGAFYGGSGFLMSIPFQQDILGVRRSHMYVVTNSHVVRESKSTFIRLNTIDGKTKVISKTYDDWIDDWNDDDLAICMLDDKIMNQFQWIAPDPSDLLTEDLMDTGLVEVGTDVITIGRFIRHDGRQQNLPVALFGNISMLNWQPIQHERKNLKQETFLVSSKAYLGTSGSPVFLGPLLSANSSSVNLLLGVAYSYFYVEESVKHKKKNAKVTDLYVNDNTGMMGVIPAWKLTKFLNRSDLLTQRKTIEAEAIKEANK